MKLLSSLFKSFLLLAGLAGAAFAHEAKVIKLTGSAQVMLPGATTATPLAINAMIPEGATITTAAGAELSIEAVPGVVATIQAGSTVVVEKLAMVKNGDVITEQVATLDLKKGNVVSTLDPAKKSVNRYGVRTPKGVAAARGTVFSVKVSVTGSTVATLSGSVTIDLGGGNVLTIPIGTASANGEATTTLAAAIASGAISQAEVAQVVSTVANQVAAGSTATNSEASATAVLASVVSVASAAVPTQAVAFTQQAITAISSPTSAVQGAAAANAVAAVTQAAVQGAVQGTAATNSTQAQQLAQEITNAAVTSAASNNVTVSTQAITNAAAQGATTGAANAGSNVTVPVITAPTNTSTTTTVVPLPITPVDTSVVSPSS